MNSAGRGNQTALPDDKPVQPFDETTIFQSRNLLKKHGLTAQMMNIINDTLPQHNLLHKGGTMVKATIVHAQPSTKNRDK